MQKTRIEWVKNPDGTQGYSWNPIKGICPVGCWYCYARKIYKRFHLSPGTIMDKEDLEKPLLIKKPSGIFVCSTFELFHKETINVDFEDMGGQWVSWREGIFDVIEACPQHRFYILTKFPENIDRPMPENVYLGVSITKNEDTWRRNRLVTTDAKVKFISFEPLFENLDFTLYQKIDWVIIGKLTGFGNKYEPRLGWIKKIVNGCADHGVKVFLKDNLKPIWGNNLIQQFPMEN